MSTINTATLKSNELSEELDDASLQAITGGLLDGIGSSAVTGGQGLSGGASLPTPFGPLLISGYQGSVGSFGATGLFNLLPI